MVLSNLSFISNKEKEAPDPQTSRHNKRLSVLWAFLTILVIALLFPKNRYSGYSYKINDITRSAVIAPFDFPILKSETELAKDRNEAIRQVPFVFKLNSEIKDAELDNLETFFTAVGKVKTAKKKYEDSMRLLDRYRYSKKFDEIQSMAQTDSISYTNLFTQLQNDYPFDKNSIVYNQLIFNSDNQNGEILSPDSFYPQLRQILSDLYAHLILDISKDKIISSSIAIIRDSEELFENIDQLLTQIGRAHV